ncbi:recombination regulator RecX, partial [Enterococcus faecalis]
EEQEQQALNKEGDRLWRAIQRFDFSKNVQKVTQSLFQKGFDYDLIQQFISEKEVDHDE